MITPEQVKRVLSSEVARCVEAVLKSDGPRADHVDMFRMCRNYLMFRILLANGQRSGVLLSLTPKIIKTGKLCQAGAVLTVSCFFFSLYYMKSSFRKFYGRYNDLVCGYNLSLAHMLNDLFHTICWTVISILALTTGYPVFLISTKGARRVWPVSRGCLLLRGTWSRLCICRRSVLPYTRICNCLLDYVYILHHC